MKKILQALTTIVFLLSSFTAMAQGRFDASLFAGANICQVDGDASGRYNHLGFRAGVGTSFALSDDISSPWRMVVEIAYSQKGSHIESANGDINLQYVELPLLLSYNTSRLRIAAGVAPAIKVGCKVMFDDIEDATQESKYRTFDWLPITASAEYYLTDSWGLQVRWQTSLVSIYNGSGPYRFFRSNHGAFNRLISIGLTYKL